MAKYHINLTSGEVGLCSATKSPCPFAREEEHFSSAEAARSYFEKTMSTFENRETYEIALSKIMDIELLQRMVAERYIMVSAHPDDNSLKLLCYGTLTQIEGKWNAATTAARGLIIRSKEADFSDAIIQERPWEKFFTLSQRENNWHLGDEENAESDDSGLNSIDFDAPAAVYDKMDGSLGIFYRAPDGLPALATKGSFGSEQAKNYTEMLRSNPVMLEAAENLLQNNPDKTILAELVGPTNRIVLAYPREDIVILGASRKIDASSVNPEEFNQDWSSRGFSTVEAMPAKTLSEALALPPREDREGMVISLGGRNPMKIKVKQDDYVKLHRIVTMFSPKESRNMVMFDVPANYQDLLDLAEDHNVERFEKIQKVLNIDGFKKGEDSYEFIRSRREDYFKKILLPRAAEISKAKAVIDGLDEEWFTREDAKKNFAMNVRNMDADKSTLFPLFKARLEGTKMSDLDAGQEMRRAAQDVKDIKD